MGCVPCVPLKFIVYQNVYGFSHLKWPFSIAVLNYQRYQWIKIEKPHPGDSCQGAKGSGQHAECHKKKHTSDVCCLYSKDSKFSYSKVMVCEYGIQGIPRYSRMCGFWTFWNVKGMSTSILLVTCLINSHSGGPKSSQCANVSRRMKRCAID